MVGEANAHVQGASLKALAALLTEACQLPDRQRGGQPTNTEEPLRDPKPLRTATEQPEGEDWEPFYADDGETEIAWYNNKTRELVQKVEGEPERTFKAGRGKIAQEHDPFAPEAKQPQPVPNRRRPVTEDIGIKTPGRLRNQEPDAPREHAVQSEDRPRLEPELLKDDAIRPARSFASRIRRLSIKALVTFVVLAIPIWGVVSCHNRDVEQQAIEAQRKAEERRILNVLLNEATMTADLDRRLADKIKVTGAFISIRDSLGAYTVSRTTPWFITCGVFGGLSVEFGVSPSESNISVPLYSSPLSEADCDKLSIPTAERYASYVGTQRAAER